MRQCTNMPMCKYANGMKKIILILAMFFTVNLLHAQTFDEWLKQKETQIKYLIEQIGALKAYAEVVNKGYGIAHHGLTDIFNGKDDDYKQQYNYFLSLWKVKPGIKNYNKLLSIYKMKADIEKQQHLVTSSFTEYLSDKEKTYINSIYSNLVEGCKDLTAELNRVTNSDQLQLKDDERIQRIDKICSEMQDRYQFSQSFSRQVKLLVVGRFREKNELDKLSSLYGVK